MLTVSDATGFIASGLVLLTFTMKDMRMLRFVAIFSNFAFIAYGFLDWLPPVLSLHLLLLPLNLYRLRQARIGAGRRLPAKFGLLTGQSFRRQLAVAPAR